MTTPAIEPLLYFIRERETIRLKRAAGEPVPWTADPILQTYRFTNVRRRDDRVSRWLIKHVLTLSNLEAAGVSNFMFFSAWCRWVNWPPTIEAVMKAGLFPTVGDLDWRAIGQVVDGLPGKRWTGAYMVLSPKRDGKMGKGEFISEHVVGSPRTYVGMSSIQRQFQEDYSRQCYGMPLIQRSRAAVWAALKDCLYWGSFMAGQVVDDWTWTPLLAHAYDHQTWAPQGPGSIRGYNRLLGHSLNKAPPLLAWWAQLRIWRRLVVSELGDQYEDLTLMDLQNCLCETDKYLRVEAGQGRPRAKYKPETAFDL